MKMKKSISLMLILCMLCSGVLANISVYAEVDQNNQTTQEPGICIHHPEHTAECGYQEETGEHSCTHVHDETCGYVEASEEVACDKGCTDTDGDGVIDHTPDCAYRPAAEGQPCNHVHDETCGYAEASEESPCSYAVNGCPYCVTGWEWGDEEELLTEVDGAWGLGLPGVNDETLLTRDTVTELLPAQITATTGTGETQTLELVWDLTAIPDEGATDGEYIVTAKLADENYALTEEAGKLEVTIQSGGAESLAQLPSGTPPFPKRIVNGVSPNGTTINLFDYWIQGQSYADNNNGDGFTNKGINANHALLFGSGMDENLGSWNDWTGNKNPRTKIVNTNLVDGYPQLNVNTSNVSDQTIRGRNGQESLAYLFDPRVAQSGKQSFEDVKGLLQVDKDGYYYYNSQNNYAVYYQDTNSFTLYDSWGVLPGGASPNGQFFPFNEATTGTGYNMNNVKSNDDSINHYFGMTMSTRFIQQNDGYTNSEKKTPVTYEFTGDDDVWIFIDGKLVADLGGIHDATSVSINFATGAIYINNSTWPTNYLGTILGTGSHTLPNNTYHTLDFFYLERGNVDSNMSLKYNLVTIPESSIIKVDQTGDVVPGATFSLYNSDKSEKIATGTTDANGEYVFLDENNFPIQISDLYEDSDKNNDTKKDLILSEENVPDGYRAASDIELYFYKVPGSDEVLLLSNSIWDKGAYAMTNVTATMPNTIRLTDREGNSKGDINLMDQIDNNPLMFAVVFQKQENGEWYPVYGDPINGWTVAEDSSWDSVLTAAKENPHQFLLASSGAYQAEIDDLPGDVTTYYHICKDVDNAKYTIAYYYSEADSLDQAKESNTWLVDSEGTNGTQPIDRVFSMNLYVTNIKNRLQVQKVDETGTPVNGAVFALYDAEQVIVADDGTVTVQEGAVPYDTVTTGTMGTPFRMEGGGTFPNNGTNTSSKNTILKAGEYYLIETSTPEGYKLNDTAAHVIIDNTGVYVDSGEVDDGLTVLRGVGSIMKSMVQFAANDKIDSTLYGIKAVPVNGEYNNGSFTWDAADWNNDEEVKHLQYQNGHGLLEYGLLDKDASLDDLTFAWDTGWSMVEIKQCLEHNEITGNHTDLEALGYTDITNLFSGSVIVRIQNQRVGNLRIEKEVQSSDVSAPADASFTFKVTVKKGETIIDLKDYMGTVDKSIGSSVTVDSNGVATVTLHNNEYLTFLGLPYGATYEVEEIPVPGGYKAEATISNEGDTPAVIDGVKVTGTIDQNDIADPVDAETVHYINTFDGSTHAILTGQKTFLYGDLSADQFQFTLEKEKFEYDDGCSFTGPESVGVNADGTFKFPDITFTKEGTYIFNIKEVLPQDVSEDNHISGGIKYDTHTAIATVKVTSKGDGKLESVVTYSNADAQGDDAGVTDKAAFTNYKVASLTVSKTVTGTMGDRDKDFEFDITLKTPQGNALTGSYGYTGGTVEGITGVDEKEDGTLTLNDEGKGKFTLKHGQSITISGLPAGCTYEISEPDAEKDGYKTTITTAEGVESAYTTEGLLSNVSTSVAFENSRDNIPNTGIMLDNLPWIIAAAIVLIGSTALLLMRIRRRSKKHGR